MPTRVTVKTLAGTTYAIEVKSNALVHDMKDAVFAAAAIPNSQQILKYEATTLEPDAKLIEEFGIADGSVVLLLYLFPGTPITTE